MRTLVVGDIHGGFKALLQVLDRCNYNSKTDRLISLGDLVDGWPESNKVIDFFVNSENCICIRGNHDEVFQEYCLTGFDQFEGSHGAKATHESYNNSIPPLSHIKLLENQLPYYIDEFGNIFVHGGWNRHYSIHNQSIPYIYWWDRDLFLQAQSAHSMNKSNQFKLKFQDEITGRIFVGHTPTTNWNDRSNKPVMVPMIADRVINLDTGAAFDGPLTIMDVETHEFWQSDLVMTLYPDHKGRNKTTYNDSIGKFN